MSVKLSMKTMESLLALPVKKRDMRWAHDVCTASRFIHINVWRFCTPRKQVETDVIPLLKKARDKLRELMGKKGFNDTKLSQYVENDTRRISNLEDNYLKGRFSAFRPDDTLSGPESQVG